MTLSKSIIQAAKKIILKNKNAVMANASNIELCTLLEIGERAGKQIYLNELEIRSIEAFFDEKLGERLITYHTHADTRIEMARQGISEKSATGTVFQCLLNVASNAPIALHGQPDIPARARYIASINIADLNLSFLSYVVIVENGEMMVHWEKVADALPDKWKDALIVYRGHGENQKDVQDLIAQLSHAQVNLALFFDYDAAGLDMAHQLMPKTNGYLVTPDLTAFYQQKLVSHQETLHQSAHAFHQDILALTKLSKECAFAAQHAQLNRLLNDATLTKGLRAHANILKEHALAVTQEHLIATKINLTVSLETPRG